MMRIYLAGVLFFASSVHGFAADRGHIDLDGTWQFRTDPESVGVREEWHSPGVSFPLRLQVPGAWQAQGVGEPDGILRHNYTGPAWYRRQINIPAAWKGKVIHLRIGGALRTTTVYVNGRTVGEHDGFSTPFNFDITQFSRPGLENTIAIRLVNPGGDLKASPDAQVSSQPAGMMNYIGNWGGFYGNVELVATAQTWVDQIAITPHVSEERASFALALGGAPVTGASLEVTVGDDYHAAANVIDGNRAAVDFPMPNAKLWTPDSPFLYSATIRLVKDRKEIDTTEQHFGMREISTRGRVLLLNGKPLYLRAYGDDDVEVLAGVPPASEQIALERVKRVRSFGFNAVRFHSMVPTKTFFDAADEAGLLVMAELPAAYTMHFLPHREFLKAELERTLRVHRNHPSFLSLAFGNEFNLEWLKIDAERKDFQATVDEFYRFAKSIDPTRLILSNDGLLLRPSDMFSLYDGAPPDAPTVRHEFGEYYCSLPDVSLIQKFTGVIRPTWLEAKARWIKASGLGNIYPDYLRNSQRLQQIGRKFQIERVRRSQDVSGYDYWLGTDYPGGTGEGDSWEEGWFDYFWQPKGIEPREGQEINSAVLLMIDRGVDQRTMWNDEPLQVGLSISNYGPSEIDDGTIEWTLKGLAGTVEHGVVNHVHAALGQVASAGSAELQPVGNDNTQKLDLVLELTSAGRKFQNQWSFWTFPHHAALKSSPINVISDVRWRELNRVYPFLKNRTAESGRTRGGRHARPSELLITQSLDEDTLEFLKNGGRVWLLADAVGLRTRDNATFFPASGGAIGSMILDHPALKGFPQDGMFDLQFFNLVEGAWNFSLDRWPSDLQPIAGAIRTTSSFLSKSKKLSRTGYLFEVRAGPGKLLVSTLRLKENFDEAYPEAIYLFDRLLRYATSDEFHPQIAASDEDLQRLVIR